MLWLTSPTRTNRGLYTYLIPNNGLRIILRFSSLSSCHAEELSSCHVEEEKKEISNPIIDNRPPKRGSFTNTWQMRKLPKVRTLEKLSKNPFVWTPIQKKQELDFVAIIVYHVSHSAHQQVHKFWQEQEIDYYSASLYSSLSVESFISIYPHGPKAQPKNRKQMRKKKLS